jgi:hypothetical protein
LRVLPPKMRMVTMGSRVVRVVPRERIRVWLRLSDTISR